MLNKPSQNLVIDKDELMIGVCNTCKTPVEVKRGETKIDKRWNWLDCPYAECPNEDCGARVLVMTKNPKPPEEPKYINVFAKQKRKDQDKSIKKPTSNDKSAVKMEKCPECGVRVTVTKKETKEDGITREDLLYSWHFNAGGCFCCKSMSII